MASALLDRLNPNLDPMERRHLWERLRTEVTTGWQTEEHPRQRLTIADEREYAVFHFAEVLYRVVPTFYEEIVTALEKLYGACITGLDLPPLVHFGTWVGGDMEGAVEANSKTVRESLERQQRVIVNEYFSECQQLSQLLSQSASRIGVSQALQRRIDEYTTLLPGARSVAPARHDQMPYRVFFAQIGERLRQTWEARAGRYERVEQLRADLRLAAQSLLANRGASAGYQLVRRLMVRVDTFGFHLATLDLKQHADVHHRVLAQGLDDPQWPQRSARGEAFTPGCDPCTRRRPGGAARCPRTPHAGCLRDGDTEPQSLRRSRDRQLHRGGHAGTGGHARAAGARPLGRRRESQPR